MANWKQFENDISEWLKTFESADVKFCHKFPIGEFRSDGMLVTDEIIIAVEVEAGQRHPDTNVGKYWYWLVDESKPRRKVVLFHVYVPGFRSNESRKKLGEFYAKKMQFEIPIDYVLLDRRKAKDYNVTLAEIKAKIGARVKQEFEVVSAD